MIFSLIGLLAFYTGKISGTRGHKIEGEWVRKLGLIIIVIDCLPLFFLFLMLVSSALSLHKISNAISDIGILALFFSPMLNILILTFASLLSKPPED